MSLKLLLLIPRLNGFQTKLGNDYTLTTPISGLPRRRKTQFGVVHTANINFTVKDSDFDYLMAFWRLTKASAFGCQLIINDSQIRWQRVRWASVPSVNYRGKGVFNVSASVIQDIPSDNLLMVGGGCEIESPPIEPPTIIDPPSKPTSYTYHTDQLLVYGVTFEDENKKEPYFWHKTYSELNFLALINDELNGVLEPKQAGYGYGDIAVRYPVQLLPVVRRHYKDVILSLYEQSKAYFSQIFNGDKLIEQARRYIESPYNDKKVQNAEVEYLGTYFTVHDGRYPSGYPTIHNYDTKDKSVNNYYFSDWQYFTQTLVKKDDNAFFDEIYQQIIAKNDRITTLSYSSGETEIHENVSRDFEDVKRRTDLFGERLNHHRVYGYFSSGHHYTPALHLTIHSLARVTVYFRDDFQKIDCVHIFIMQGDKMSFMINAARLRYTYQPNAKDFDLFLTP